jgi:aspartate kinase
MKVFKFGGASVKNADGVKNIASIIQAQESQDLVIVISAMGKMTNAFEALIKSYVNQTEDFKVHLDYIRTYHFDIVGDLFGSSDAIYTEIELYFAQIAKFFHSNKNPDYDYIYDQIVSYGELISTKIISHYLNASGVDNTWLDARQIIHTDFQYRTANVDWVTTDQNIQHAISQEKTYITQGFIGGAAQDTTTTLGREGSDYTAAIFSHALNAESMTIWKDVPGVLNADPRHFEQTTLLEKISYREALEMAFYGATVIHPKTIKPLENKNIALHVRSFLHPELQGTVISKGTPIFPESVCYTYKEQQILLSISTKDFSFMMEYNISHIFQIFTENRIKVNLIQNSAISFSVCIEDLYQEFEHLKNALSEHYNIEFYQNVKLISIRHYTPHILQEFENTHSVLLIQQSNEVAQMVIK